MSNSQLIQWFDYLLFGDQHPSISSPPCELKKLFLRMEAENIPWAHIALQGGFTAFSYNVHGDLNSLIDHLEKQWLDQYPPSEPETFRTRAVFRFWNELQVLLARRQVQSPAPPVPLQQDDTILKDILVKPPYQQVSYSYQSASFWGEIARRFLNVRRPMNDSSLSILPRPSLDVLKRTVLLYDVTCQSRGQYWDPLSMYLVPRSEYINAVHWQSDKLLEKFMRNQPTHPLTKSIQALLQRTLNQLFHGQKPTAILNPCPQLDALLHNVNVIHTSVQQVPFQNAPPKLIDVFQRLLALSQRDNLWEMNVPPSPPQSDETSGMDLFQLAEQLQITERQNQLLWKNVHLNEDDSGSDPGPLERICSDPYARDKTTVH